MGPLKLEAIRGACTCHLCAQMVLLWHMLGSVNWQAKLVHQLLTELGEIHYLFTSMVFGLLFICNLICERFFCDFVKVRA